MRQENDLPVDPLSLSALMSRYLDSRIEVGDPAPELGSEVVLHDAGPVQPIEARLAWDEALTAIQLGGPKANLPSMSAVSEWRALVAAQEPALDLAFCSGNFPQMVRNLSLLLAGGTDGPTPKPFESTTLSSWAEQTAHKSSPLPLLSVGLLRLARDFERAERLLAECEKTLPAEWHAAWKNESAALAWHSGRRAEALAMWQAIDGDYVPALFNRGMASLFLGKPADATASLKLAISRLPESGSWHHLARLYLTLAEMRQ